MCVYVIDIDPAGGALCDVLAYEQTRGRAHHVDIVGYCGALQLGTPEDNPNCQRRCDDSAWLYQDCVPFDTVGHAVGFVISACSTVARAVTFAPSDR